MNTQICILASIALKHKKSNFSYGRHHIGSRMWFFSRVLFTPCIGMSK